MQLSLFEPALRLPDGFRYRPELSTPGEEQELIEAFRGLEFRPYEFHGYLGRRKVVSFGLHYDFGERRVRESRPFPEFLLKLRDRAAAFADVASSALAMALVTEYQPGAPIGWHRDRPVFGDIIGVSFLSPCRFRFRRRSPLPNPPPLAGEGDSRRRRVSFPPPPAGEGREGAFSVSGWERTEITLQPRSVYLLRGEARTEWEHSIPPMEQLRYSVTFRTLRDKA